MSNSETKLNSRDKHRPPNPSGTYVLRIMRQNTVGKDSGKLPSVRSDMCR